MEPVPLQNCLQQLPLPTSQARAGGRWQFKQVVVVDIAVVVVLVVVVVDLHLIHLVCGKFPKLIQ